MRAPAPHLDSVTAWSPPTSRHRNDQLGSVGGRASRAAPRRHARRVRADAEQVFAAVAEEAGRLLGARSSATVRFDEETAVVVGRWNSGELGGLDVETLIPYTDPEGPTARLAREGGRIDDYTDVPGEAARMMREAGYRSSVASPIIAGGRTWGALFVLSVGEPFTPDAEQRLRDFAELVALALESAEAHDQLTASRARIAEAAVAERRRLERNLHDGAQQQLVTLALHLRMAQESLPDDTAAAEACSCRVGDELEASRSRSSASSRAASTQRSSPTAGSSRH